MPTCNAEDLLLSERHFKMLLDLLHENAAHLEVWAYGSRVNGDAHEASDLDLVLRNPDDLAKPVPNLGKICEAFTESNLPIRVELMDWARIPESFRREIEKGYVVLQCGGSQRLSGPEC